MRRADGGPPGRSQGIRSEHPVFPLAAGMSCMANDSSGEPVEVPGNEVDAHLGNPEKTNI